MPVVALYQESRASAREPDCPTQSRLECCRVFTLVAFGVLRGIVGMLSNPQQIGRFFDSIPWF